LQNENVQVTFQTTSRNFIFIQIRALRSSVRWCQVHKAHHTFFEEDMAWKDWCSA